ncbi:MAG: adenylate cyclase [Solirubrobacteraceae bacterium]|jgi:adenylate cyclase|nr:adenylate cyclase [Solirubrobacteraceae bacterium]
MNAQDGAAAAVERKRLLERLREAGCGEGEIERAEREGRLPALAVELALGGKGRHTLTQVARSSGLDTAFLRELMQAVGRPNPARGERVFTDDDVEHARLIKQLVDAGLPRRELLEVGRVIGQGMAQAAEAIRRLVGDALLRPGDSEETVALRYVQAADQLGPLVPRLLGHQFRAQLRDGMQGQLVTEAEREAGRLAGTREVAVAFADLVDYTGLGERLPPEDLGRIAGRLAEIAVATLKRPTRLVKTIGDAAMFVSEDVDALLASLRDLLECVEAEGESFPAVRIGVALGAATPRGGDWFGSTVNLASRVTEIAKPGRILATDAVQERTPELPWHRRRRRKSLKGIDAPVRLYALDAPAPAKA